MEIAWMNRRNTDMQTCTHHHAPILVPSRYGWKIGLATYSRHDQTCTHQHALDLSPVALWLNKFPSALKQTNTHRHALELSRRLMAGKLPFRSKAWLFLAGNSVCMFNQCSQLCLPKPHNLFSCSCKTGYRLTADAHTCIPGRSAVNLTTYYQAAVKQGTD